MDYYFYEDLMYSDAFAGVMVVWIILALAIGVLTIVALWKVFTKAGEEGWAAIVPFYNSYILFKISWGNGWFFLIPIGASFLSWIPILGIILAIGAFVFHIITMIKLSNAFGKGGGFACGLIFLNTIFIMILGFGSASYVGPGGVAPPPPSGGYDAAAGTGGFSGAPQEPGYRQYTQSSEQNPNYHYQRNEPQGGIFCHVCGARLEEGVKFCPSCGRQL